MYFTKICCENNRPTLKRVKNEKKRVEVTVGCRWSISGGPGGGAKNVDRLIPEDSVNLKNQHFILKLKKNSENWGNFFKKFRKF